MLDCSHCELLCKCDDHLLVLFFGAVFFGTLAPFLRASERPIAIACFRLVTRPPFPPLPERRVPFFLRRIALATVLLAALPYLRRLELLRELFLVAMQLLPPLEGRVVWQVASASDCARRSRELGGCSPMGSAAISPWSCVLPVRDGLAELRPEDKHARCGD